MRHQVSIIVAVMLAAGCSKHADLGSVACWGNGFSGQLGTDDRADHAAPIAVAGVAGATHVTAYATASCAWRGAVAPVCWGSFDTLGGSNVAAPIPAFADAIQLATGARFGCMLHRAGTVSCWGANLVGQLGNGRAPDPDTKVAIPLDGTAPTDTAVTAGDSATPVAVTGVADATQLVAAGSHACVIRRDQTVACWGANGGPGAGPVDHATAVPGLAGVTQLATGPAATCALAHGEVWCWGGFGETAGVGPPTWPAPTKIAGVTDVAELALDRDGACARTTAGAITCWSGDGHAAPRAVDHAVQLGGAFDHFCARLATGGVACWGDNLDGQLGAREVGASGIVVVPGLDHVTELAVGDAHNCVLRAP